jgi:uncharacterized membrane protein
MGGRGDGRLTMGALPWLDIAGLAVFAAMWLGYGPVIRAVSPGSINASIGSVRIAWMRSMLRRDNRIFDSGLIGHVVHSASFFTSTSLIMIGALLSLLSNAEHLQPAIESVAFVAPVSRTLFEMKIVLPLTVLLHGFVKLTWSIRQLNYTIALMGAAPDRNSLGPFLEDLANSIGHVMSAALSTFNTGMRSYYFAVAGLAWLVGPWAMAATAVALTAMLVWRQLVSPAAIGFRTALNTIHAAHDALRK